MAACAHHLVQQGRDDHPGADQHDRDCPYRFGNNPAQRGFGASRAACQEGKQVTSSAPR